MEIDEINVRAMFMSSPVIVHITNYQFTCDGDAMRRSMHAKNYNESNDDAGASRMAKAHRMGEHAAHRVRPRPMFRMAIDDRRPSAASTHQFEHAVSAMRFPTAKCVTAESRRLISLRRVGN